MLHVVHIHVHVHVDTIQQYFKSELRLVHMYIHAIHAHVDDRGIHVHVQYMTNMYIIHVCVHVHVDVMYTCTLGTVGNKVNTIIMH